MSLLFTLGSRGPNRPLRWIERRYGRLLPLAVLLGLLGSGLEALSIAVFVRLSILLLSPASDSGSGLVVTQIARTAEALVPSNPIVGMSLMVLMLVCGKSGVQIANAQFMSAVEGRAGRDIRDALAAKILRLDFRFFLENDSDRLATIVHTESWQATDAVRVLFNIAAGAAAVAMFSVLLLLSEWRLSLIVLAGVAVTRVIQWLLSRRIARLARASIASNHLLAAQMMQVVRAIRVIRLFGQEPREESRFRSLSEDVRRTMQRTARWSASTMPVIEIVLSALILIVLLCADVLGVPLVTTAAFLVLLYRVQSPLLMVGHSFVHMATLRGAIEAVEWLLDQPEGPDAAGGAAADMKGRTIVFDRVDFAYPKRTGERAVRDLSFELPPGSITALVGSSGAGKSTVINLLCRLIEPTAGRLLLDDRDAAPLDIRQWRAQIALAGQDVDMVLGSVRDNIAYGCADVSEADVEEAARSADAHDFIRDLPDGYDTQLGALGFGLSGGQRQRIGLARALVRRPEILILDEATSAVDGPSERAIMALLHQHRRFGRAIVISHRRSTLSMCDYGIVIADGAIIERGMLRQLEWYRREAAESEPSARGI